MKNSGIKGKERGVNFFLYKPEKYPLENRDSFEFSIAK